MNILFPLLILFFAALLFLLAALYFLLLLPRFRSPDCSALMDTFTRTGDSII